MWPHIVGTNSWHLASANKQRNILCWYSDKTWNMCVSLESVVIAGPPGLKGTRGAPGPRGPPGAAGAKSSIGPAGLPGVQGPPGSMGSRGANGPIGAAGIKGDLGPSGMPGLRGATGNDTVLSTSCFIIIRHILDVCYKYYSDFILAVHVDVINAVEAFNKMPVAYPLYTVRHNYRSPSVFTI